MYLELHAGIEKAEELIRKAVAITPDHRAYYLDTLGVVLLRPGRTEESLAALKQALELMPGDNAGHLAEAHLHLAEAYRIAGDAASAGEAEQAAKKYRAPQ